MDIEETTSAELTVSIGSEVYPMFREFIGGAYRYLLTAERQVTWSIDTIECRC